MIIVRLTGGLGNQMFQYALGRHLAEKLSTTLKLDPLFYESNKLRHYELHCFHIWEHIATQAEIDALRREQRTRLYHFLQRGLRKLKIDNPITRQPPNPFHVREADHSFHPEVLEKSGPLYLDGYWQSEKYFRDIAEIIHREFEIKYKQDAESQRISELIHATESVSLHVRRADYVQNPVVNQIHGTCDQAYYDRAIHHLTQSIQNPHFFLFSDDPAWVKAELKLDFPATILEHNGPSRSYEDLRLMSQCKHNIIANSSFSWWGAWLNKNPAKIVVAPARWYADPVKNAQTKDVVPETWVKQ